nr:oxysterol-binding protein-like protein obpalpha [Quercus suber]
MSKKRKDIPDLQEALDKRWCYYCERIFQDDKVLCDHQRYKHFRCDWDQQYSCGKKFTTAGGLSVHMTQVHKTKLEKIQNTIDGRENPAVEIFGMLGIPQELLDAHRREIETQYYQAEAEHRARTGNPLRGPNPNAGKKQVEELTHEEKMAKLEAHRAKNRANKAAREAGYKDVEDQARQLAAQNSAQNVTTVESVDAFANMQPPVPGFQTQPPFNVTMAGSPLSPHPQFLPPAYSANSSASPGPGPYNNGFISHSPNHNTNNGFVPLPYANGNFGIQPQTNGFVAPPQEFSGYQAPMPPQPRATPQSQSASTPLPAPTPGLPARPSFNSIPNFTREEMAQLHGAGQPPPSLNAHNKRIPRVTAPSSGHTTDNKEFSASLADMINQEAQNAQNKNGFEHIPEEQDRAAENTSTITPAKTQLKKPKSKKDNQVMKVQDQVVSLEELKAADRKFVSTFLPQPTSNNLRDANGIPWSPVRLTCCSSFTTYHRPYCDGMTLLDLLDPVEDMVSFHNYGVMRNAGSLKYSDVVMYHAFVRLLIAANFHNSLIYVLPNLLITFTTVVPTHSSNCSPPKLFIESLLLSSSHPVTTMVLGHRKASVTSSRGSTDEPRDSEDAGDETVVNSEQGSVLAHIISQLRPGADLSRVTLPTFILEPKSMLERITNFMAHPETLLPVPDIDDPLHRFVAVTKFYLAGWHIKPAGVKKPLNPILGETFAGYWDYPDKTRGYYIAEQTSHHPPKSSYFFMAPEHQIRIDGTLKPRSKFLGNSVGSFMEGIALMSNSFVTQPNMYARGILFGKMKYELGDHAVVRCPESGLEADIEFKVKGWVGGNYNAIGGHIKESKSGKNLFELSGFWDGEMTIKDLSTGKKEVLFDAGHARPSPVQTRPIEEQSARESQRLWYSTTTAIKKADQKVATEEKSKIEDEQRQEASERGEGHLWQPKLFKAVSSGDEENLDWILNAQVDSQGPVEKQIEQILAIAPILPGQQSTSNAPAQTSSATSQQQIPAQQVQQQQHPSQQGQAQAPQQQQPQRPQPVGELIDVGHKDSPTAAAAGGSAQGSQHPSLLPGQPLYRHVTQRPISILQTPCTVLDAFQTPSIISASHGLFHQTVVCFAYAHQHYIARVGGTPDNLVPSSTTTFYTHCRFCYAVSKAQSTIPVLSPCPPNHIFYSTAALVYPMAHIILTGVTGSAGSAILSHALTSPAISRISILSRRPVTLALNNPKAHTILHQDFTQYPESTLAQLRGATTCIWALGISSRGMTEDEYSRITHDFPVAAAQAFASMAAEQDTSMVFVHISGDGAEMDEGKSRMMFGRIKGKAERRLLDMQAQLSALRVYNLRPALINPQGRYLAERKPGWQDRMSTMLGAVMERVAKGYVIPTAGLARACVVLATGDGAEQKGEGIVEGSYLGGDWDINVANSVWSRQGSTVEAMCTLTVVCTRLELRSLFHSLADGPSADDELPIPRGQPLRPPGNQGQGGEAALGHASAAKCVARLQPSAGVDQPSGSISGRAEARVAGSNEYHARRSHGTGCEGLCDSYGGTGQGLCGVGDGGHVVAWPLALVRVGAAAGTSRFVLIPYCTVHSIVSTLTVVCTRLELRSLFHSLADGPSADDELPIPRGQPLRPPGTKDQCAAEGTAGLSELQKWGPPAREAVLCPSSNSMTTRIRPWRALPWRLWRRAFTM